MNVSTDKIVRERFDSGIKLSKQFSKIADANAAKNTEVAVACLTLLRFIEMQDPRVVFAATILVDAFIRDVSNVKTDD